MRAFDVFRQLALATLGFDNDLIPLSGGDSSAAPAGPNSFDFGLRANRRMTPASSVGLIARRAKAGYERGRLHAPSVRVVFDLRSGGLALRPTRKTPGHQRQVVRPTRRARGH